MQVVRTISGTSPAAPGTAVVGTAVDLSALLEDIESLDVIATIVGATGGVLDLYLQCSSDGTTWTDFAHFAQLTAGAASSVKTFSVSRFSQQSTITAVGQNLTPALAANTAIGGPVEMQIRCLAVAGASTTAGGAQSIKLVATGRRQI
jgi:hypothetical protein